MDSQFTVLNGGAAARHPAAERGGGNGPALYDFRKPDCLPTSQIRQLYGLFESFLRSLDTRVSTYLRFGLNSRALGVEQQLYAEFLAQMSRPTCLFSLSLKPYPANAILELSPQLVFPVLEILLGAKAGGQVKIGREITEIERNVLNEILPVILDELRDTWKQFTPVEFDLEGSETNPQSIPVLLSTEPVVAFRAEVRVGEESGTMSLAVPSIAIKMMKAKSDQVNSSRETRESTAVPERTLDVLKRAKLRVEARLEGSGILIRDLLELKLGQIVAFSHTVDRPLDCVINGQQVYKGEVVTMGTKVAFQIGSEAEPSE